MIPMARPREPADAQISARADFPESSRLLPGESRAGRHIEAALAALESE